MPLPPLSSRSPDPGVARRKRFFGHGDLRLVILDLLSQRPGHAYELIKSVEALTHGYYVPSTGVVYPTLDHLQQHGFIEIGGEENGRREITITAAGLAHLQAESAALADIQQRIKARTIGHNIRRHPEMKRALDNIKSALDLAVNQRALSAPELAQVVAIIDGAAEDIRRLATK
ncbi:PadR family transcriptional regulator [Shimwellia pseudoproteus]|uniref:PadR family transcriptional regulator n=1 Tax=Shimwellia pseudoproteus TaxID=570012 RepID=UPI0018ED6902|nr:PadR family transcriptional regulator [Shimwellia pseudoproteus]MBJ3815365.1 PadR family transcriptional regulator [Shimwellia pseudoproteus]